ncbi:MAG: acetate kinase, partial [Eubacteriales bacterium]|nr:acetate kinase [Eubacteriales bacterium]
KMVICHLGSGSSITALRDGNSVDNSMSFTPLTGIPMGTRSGDIDPTILTYMAKKMGTDCQAILADANRKSGLLGLSGLSSDLRDIIEASNKGYDRATSTIKVLVYRIRKYIGAYAAVLNGLDCLVFTAGIGERSAMIRELVCKDMNYLGIVLDNQKNTNLEISEGGLISKHSSKVKVLVIPTNEELTIARETKKLIEKSG